MPNWKKVILSGSNAHVNNLTASGHFSALDNGFTVNNNNSTELFVDGNIIATGDITGENYIVSSTIMHMTQSFSDGSTIFGDTLNDTHRFTGSLFITGITHDSTPVGDGVVVIDTANGRLYYTGSYGGAGGSGTGFPFTGSAGVSGSIIIDGDINVGGGVFTSASLASAVAGDNLGNHTATTNLDLASNNINQVGQITANQYNVAQDIRDNVSGNTRIEFADGVMDMTFNNEADQNINMTPKSIRFYQPITASAPISASAGNYIFGPQLLGSNGFQQSAPYDSTGSIIAYGQSRDNVILQVNDNTKEHGIAFRNSGGAYTNVIYRTQANNPSNIADLRIAGGTNNNDPTALNNLLTISASGNVGIGTTTPHEKLTVRGSMSASGNLFASLSLDSSNLNTVMYNTATGQFFHTGSYGGGGGGSGTGNTGSLLETASVSGNTITFTQGDSTTFNIDINPTLQEVTDEGNVTTRGSRFLSGQNLIWGGLTSNATSGFVSDGGKAYSRVTPQVSPNGQRWHPVGNIQNPSFPGRLNASPNNYLVYNIGWFVLGDGPNQGGGGGGGGGGIGDGNGGTQEDDSVGGLVIEGGGLQLKTTSSGAGISGISLVPGDGRPSIYFFESASGTVVPSGSLHHGSASAKIAINTGSHAIEFFAGSVNEDLVKVLHISKSGDSPRIGIGTDSPKSTFDFRQVEDTSTGTELLLRSARSTQGAISGDEGGSINFAIDSSSFNNIKTSGSLAKIKTIVNSVGVGGAQGILAFELSKGAGPDGLDVFKYGFAQSGGTAADFNLFSQIQTASLLVKDFSAGGYSVIEMRDSSDNFKLQIGRGNITASGNISSSGQLTANNALFGTDGIEISSGKRIEYTAPNIKVRDTGLYVAGGSITASSDISASGTIFATRIHPNGPNGPYLDEVNSRLQASSGFKASTELVAGTNITASGDISASGTIIMLTASIGGGTFTSASLAGAIASAGDITGVTAGSGLSGGGSSGAVTVNVDYGSGTIITDAGAFNTGGTSVTNDLLLVHHNDDGEAQKVGITAFMDEYKIVNRTGTPVDNDYAKFTDANTIEGRSFSEVKTDLSLGNVTNESKATMFTSPTFTGNITASGNVTMGTASIEHRLFDTGSTHLGANSAIGDIVKFGGGDGDTVAGGIYFLKHDGTWALAQANAASTATASLAVAVGTNPSVDGMCLRGFVNPFSDPGAGIGSPVFLNDTNQGRFIKTAPDTSGDIVRILGHQFGTDLIYFNPSPDFIEVS